MDFLPTPRTQRASSELICIPIGERGGSGSPSSKVIGSGGAERLIDQICLVSSGLGEPAGTKDYLGSTLSSFR